MNNSVNKLALCILKELQSKNTNLLELCNSGVTKEELGTALEELTEKKLISGASVVRGGRGNSVRIIFCNDARITMDGEEYLLQNSTLMKLYKGIKEFSSWIPSQF